MSAPSGDPSTRRADAVTSFGKTVLPAATGVPNRLKVAAIMPALGVAKVMDAMATRSVSSSEPPKNE